MTEERVVNVFAPTRPHAGQAKVLKALDEGQRFVLVRAGRKWRKCEWEKTWLSVVEDGSPKLVQAKDLIGKEFQVYSLGNDTKFHLAWACAERNGVEEVYRVTTRSGRNVEVTSNHPLLTILGWKPISELKIGDYIAVPTLYPKHGTKTENSDLVKVVGYLLGDGGLTHSNPIFTQQNGVQLQEFIRCIRNLGGEVKYIDRYDYRVKGLNDLFRSLGMMGKGSRHKVIPSRFTCLNRYQTGQLLSRLFATDGFYSDTHHQKIGYCSVSRNLVKQVQLLLLRFGINARVYRKQLENGPAYELSITRERDLYQFSRQIGIKGKLSRQEKIVKRAYKKTSRLSRYGYKHLAYDDIIEIMPLGKKPTVAIEVPTYGNYITGVVEHNTSLGISWLFEGAMSNTLTYPYIAPNRVQAKNIAWDDHVARLLTEFRKKGVPYKTNETELSVSIGGAGKVQLFGVENQEALRGISNWGRCVADEYDDWEEDIWPTIIRPNLMVHQAPAIIMGTPKGFRGMYKLENNPDFKAFHFTSYDNPDLPRAELESMVEEYKKLGEDYFRQEIMAEYVKPVGVVYREWDMDRQYIPLDYDPNLPLHVSFDWGVNDPTAIIWIQPYGAETRVIDYYEASDASIEHFIQVINAKPYKKPDLFTGDPAGKARTLTTGTSVIEMLADKGIFVRTKDGVRIPDQIRIAHEKMPGLYVAKDRAEGFRDCLLNYRYPEKSTGLVNQENEIPIHDRFSHGIRAFEYWAVNVKDGAVVSDGGQFNQNPPPWAANLPSWSRGGGRE